MRVSEKKRKVPVCMRVREPVCVCVRARSFVLVCMYGSYVAAYVCVRTNIRTHYYE